MQLNEQDMIQQRIIRNADQCVKCGMCAPVCPTYALQHDENESPRGRIALMHTLASKQLAPSPPLQQSLDHCLGCGACEKMCPAKVPYQQLLSDTRSLLYQNNLAQPRWLSLLLWLLRRKKLLRASLSFLSLCQRSGLYALICKLGKLRGFAGALPSVDRPIRLGVYCCKQTNAATIELFSGCIAQSVDNTTLQACITLLQHCGYHVNLSKQQRCCGALHAHAGQPPPSSGYGSQQTIISSATGCARQLQSAGLPVVDIANFLVSQPLSTLRFQHSTQQVLVHTPCTADNAQALHALLTRVPGLRLNHYKQQYCCGAAGSYMLQQATLATKLRQPLVAAIQQQTPDIVLTSNIGCRLHLQRALSEQGLHIPVMHPAIFLAKQLD